MNRAILTIIFLISAGCNDDQKTGSPVRVEIPVGSSVSAIADTLAAHGIISSTTRFRWYARIAGKDRALHAGVFDLTTGMSVKAAIERLAGGQAALEPLVVQEGLMLTEVAAAVQRMLGLDSAEFMAGARNPELRLRLGTRGPTLEGYLYPTTYHVRIGATVDEVIAHMVTEFERQWDSEWTSRLVELGMSRDELITLASIVEGEVLYTSDGPYVSSVYHNRLRLGMRLQADPTVIYALGRRRRLFERDYDIRSSFNTYQIDGLPPHPIGQASIESIRAALFPTKTDFLYFVAGQDGRHVFTRSFRDHLAAIRRIRGG